MIKRIHPFLLLALVAAACQGEGPTVPAGDPAFAKGGIPGKPGDKPDEGPTTEVELCAKRSVVDVINTVDEQSSEPWGDIPSTAANCECGDWPEYCPRGTLKYSTAGPVFQWTFNGRGFVSQVHKYVLIYYPDPWPGRDLICLEEATANRGGKIRFSGSKDLGLDLGHAKMWIVRLKWVDCNGEGFKLRENPDPGVPRLTNDRNRDDTADATESCVYPFGSPPYPCDDASLAYDWLFETELIQ